MERIASGKQSTFPCAACKILRRRCGEKCVLAPYFPPDNPHKFATAHRVFGASNIIKMLKDLPYDRRADAVSSMVYEAEARLRDPVYGCAGTVCHLQHQISKLQTQLATAQAEILKLHLQQANLVSLVSRLYKSGEESEPFSSSESDPQDNDNDNSADHNNDLFSEDSDPMLLWEPLWP
ncbi:hypothetical protein KI387_043718 [Taxus chinensis]|uniref:LOB domain-containing protein n=1 Tax=Taxus chinensis TaxID=29808 RepID=A0AA38LSN7_TAXCH|nr:hypothetical protein KI387_043718 [Taxus chinensis]